MQVVFSYNSKIDGQPLTDEERKTVQKAQAVVQDFDRKTFDRCMLGFGLAQDPLKKPSYNGNDTDPYIIFYLTTYRPHGVLQHLGSTSAASVTTFRNRYCMRNLTPSFPMRGPRPRARGAGSDVFVDRDPTRFEYCVEYFRFGMVTVPHGLSKAVKQDFAHCRIAYIRGGANPRRRARPVVRQDRGGVRLPRGVPAHAAAAGCFREGGGERGPNGPGRAVRVARQFGRADFDRCLKGFALAPSTARRKGRARAACRRRRSPPTRSASRFSWPRLTDHCDCSRHPACHWQAGGCLQVHRQEGRHIQYK